MQVESPNFKTKVSGTFNSVGGGVFTTWISVWLNSYKTETKSPLTVTVSIPLPHVSCTRATKSKWKIESKSSQRGVQHYLKGIEP